MAMHGRGRGGSTGAGVAAGVVGTAGAGAATGRGDATAATGRDATTGAATGRDAATGHGAATGRDPSAVEATGTRTAGWRGGAWARLGDAAGLGCLFSTLLIYTSAVSPFQRYASVELFVPPTTRACLRAALVVSLAALALVLVTLGARSRRPARAAAPRARVRPGAALLAGGAVLYLAGCLGFCLLATGALPSGSAVWHGVAGGLAGSGCVLELLAWGRHLRGYDLAGATGVTSGAALLAVATGLLLLEVPLGAVAPLFLALAAGACAVPIAGARRTAGGPAGGTAPGCGAGDVAGANGSVGAGAAGAMDAARAGASGAPATSGLAWLCGAIPQAGAFLDVAAIPAIGLVLFAMIMAVRAGQFVEDLPAYGTAQVLVATLLMAMALGPRRSLVRVAYRSLIPLLAVAAIAYCNVSELAWGGSPLDLPVVFLLYSAAAVLTVSTIVGIVHAGEFSCELVVLGAVALFVGATLLSSSFFAHVAAVDVRLFVAIVTGAYAVGMIAYALVRAGRLQADDLAGVTGAVAAPRAASRTGTAGASDPAAGEAVATGSAVDGAPAAVVPLPARCDAIAARYRLTNREREVLEILAQGHNAVYVGEALLISQNTARTHVHNIYRKLGISSREELLALVAADA